MIYQNIIELIGKTPIVKLNKIFKFNDVYAKLEKYNPMGSVKDRIVDQIIKSYLEQGLIKKGGTILEATSGNTGIALAGLSAYYGLNCIIVMPKNSSIQRRELIKAYGGELILVDGGMKECKEKVIEINSKTQNSVILNQFENDANYRTHYLYTAKEIDEELKNIDVIILGIGSGGSITGIGKYFKEKNRNIEIIGVEPRESPLLTKGVSGNHKIQGIGPDFVPQVLDRTVIDRIITVSYHECVENCKMLTMLEGYLVGLSSGAVIEACNQLLLDEEYKGKRILLIFPDTGERYSWN